MRSRLESLAYRCRPCGLTFSKYQELEKHCIEVHLDMTNESKRRPHLALAR